VAAEELRKLLLGDVYEVAAQGQEIGRKRGRRSAGKGDADRFSSI
jgi:hypothetical protein